MSIMKSFFCALVIAALADSILADSFPCPFNPKECTCQNATDPSSKKYDFDEVDCISDAGAVIKFTPKFLKKYTVGYFYIVGNVADLPRNYLAAFSSIDQLNLKTSDGVKRQNWNRNAFDGCKVRSLLTLGLDNLLPPPAALTRLGAQGLQVLHIANGQQPIKLLDNQLRPFKSLLTFYIYSIPVSQITDGAFAGVEDTLKNVYIFNTACPADGPRGFTPFLKLRNLNRFALSGSGIRDIPLGAFANYKNLEGFELSQDQLAPLIDAGLLDKLPANLKYLALINVTLTKVPQLSYSGSQLNQLDLAQNNIQQIKVGDFLSTTTYSSLNFDQNPLVNIENGVSLNSQAISFSSTKLGSLDLSIFGKETTSVNLDNTVNLKKIFVSNPKQDFSLKKLQVNPSLEVIDSNVETLLSLNPTFQINLVYNTNLSCKNLNWITPYVLCTQQVILEDATCSDGSSAFAYFANLGYQCPTAAPSQ